MRAEASRFERRRASRRVGLAMCSVLLALGATLLMQPPPAVATSITVNTVLDPLPNQGSGKYPHDGLCSLRAAIAAAQFNSNASDTDCATGLGGTVLDSIHIDASLTGKTITMSPLPFDIIYGNKGDNPMEIIGPTTNSADFVIDGNNATRIFEVGYAGFGNDDLRGTLKIANLTIKGGNGRQNVSPLTYAAAEGDGGAMYLGDGTHLTLDNVVLRDNTVTGSSRGAAIYGVHPTITNNGGAYINNRATGNGGTGAGGGRGGAVFMEQGPSILNGYAVLFDSNTASYAGGAVATNPGTITSTVLVHLERSLAKNNTAKVGAMYYTDPSAPGTVFEYTDSTATGNNASQSGGVFFGLNTTMRFSFLRDTFVGNGGVGGLFTAGGGEIRNSIVVDSGCNNTATTSNFSANILIGGTNTGCAFLGGTAVTGLSPTLAQNGGPEIQQTFALASNSNAIDSANSAWCGTIDARSVPRGVNGIGAVNSPAAGDCDFGAYEYANYVVNFVTGTSSVLEGNSTTVQVRLKIPDVTKRPLTSPLTVNVTRNQASTARYPIDYTTGPGTVTFPTGSTDGAIANFTFSTVQDNIAERNGEFALLDLSGVGVAVAEPKQHTVTIQDDDQAGVIKNDGGNGTTVSEATTGVSDSLAIQLRSQPDYSQPDPNDSNSYGPLADVTIHLQPDRDCRVVAGGNSATLGHPIDFTILNANWNSTSNTITVFPIDDPWDEDFRNESAPHQCTLTFTFSSGDPVYNATTDSYDVNVIDNDVAGVTVVQSGGSTNIVEGGATDTYTVVLETPPDPGKPLPGVPRAATQVIATPDQQCDAGAGRGAAKALSFDASNWNVPQTFTVTAFDDPTVELNHTCAITTTISSPDPVYADLDDAPSFAKTPAGVTAQVKDFEPPAITNDPPNVVITTTNGVQVDEGASATFDTMSVVLFRQPLNQNVTVTLASSTDPRNPGPGGQLLLQDDLSSTPAAPAATLTLTFTPANWNVAQIVRVFAVNDDFDEADPHSATVDVSMSSTAVGFNDSALRKFVIDNVESANTGAVPVTILDNDVSSILVTESGGSTSVTEGGATDTYTFRLGTHPYADVTVTITPNAQCDIGNGAGVARSFLIAHANWNVAQSITVTARDDRLSEAPATCVISHSSTSTDVLYNNLAGAPVNAAVTDNDPPRVLVTKTGTVTVAEATANVADTYSVVLFSQPDADVTVNVNVTDGQTVVATGGGAKGSTAALTFSNANWNVAQTVSVYAVDDFVDESDPHPGAIGHSVTSTATRFSTAPEIFVNGASASTLAVSIGDDDTADVTVVEPGGSTSVTEGGATDTYTVVLTSQPVAGVTIGATASPQCSVAPASVAFTAANWNVAQTFTVSAVDDNVVEPAGSCALTNAATSSDPKYQGIPIAGVNASVLDNDVARVSITASGLTLSEASPATTASYSVVLGAGPLANVTVTATVTDGQTALSAAGATTSSLTFTPANWNTPQTVTVWVVDDSVDESDPHLGSIATSVTSTAFGYSSSPIVEVNGAAGAAVSVSIADNDTAALVVTESAGSTDVAEGGPADTYTVRLGTRPLAPVTVTVMPGAQCDVGSGAGVARSYVIAVADWNTPVTVSVTALDDRLVEATSTCDVTSLATSAGDANYNGLAGPTVSAHVTDNDLALVLVSTGNGLAVAEATSATADSYTVVLGNAPDANVTVNISVTDGQTVVSTAAGAPAASLALTFTPADWDTPQTVSVRAVDDQIDEADTHAGAIAHSVTSTATGFAAGAQLKVDANAGSTVSVSIADNDTAGVTVVESGGSTVVAEGGVTDTYTVVLNTQPVTPVTIAASGSQCSTTPASLTFDATDWNTPKSFTVSAVDDNVVEPTSNCPIANRATGDPRYQGIAVAGVNASVIDNDVARVVITASGLALAEETPAVTASYSVVLGAAPLNDVVVNATVTDGQTTLSAAGATTNSLTFTPGNWNVPQTVTVWVVDDLLIEATPHTGAIASSVTSTAFGYSATPVLEVNGVAGNVVSVGITDNDTPAIRVFESGTTDVTEGGATDTYTFRLGTLTAAPVTVTVTPGAQCDVGSGPGVARAYIVASANWNVLTTVTVTAVDDRLVEAATTCAIGHMAASTGDANYNNLAGPTVTAHVTDNDAPTVLIATGNGVAVSEATPSTADTYTVVLGNQPDADVAVNVTVVDGQSVVSTGAGTPAASLTLTFTNGNWNTAQTVSVRAVDDRVDEIDPHAGSIGHTVTSTATGFATAAEVRVDGAAGNAVPVAIADDDTAGVTLAESGGSTSVTEGGATDTYTVVLNSQPVAGVTVAVATGPECMATSPVAFDASDWSTPKTVTVSAVDDNVVEPPGSCAISHSATSADPKYQGIAIGGVTVSVVDNDVPLVSITATGLVLSEAAPATTTSYSVVLGGTPLADVTVTPAVTDGQTTVSGPLTFTPANWNVAQTVTVSVVDDVVTEPDPHTGAIGHSVTSTAFGFSSAPVFQPSSTVSVSIADNDAPSMVVAESGTTDVTEGGATDSYTFRLGTRPFAGVTVTVTPGAQCDVGSGPGTARQFLVAAADWNTAVTVTVTAVDDRLVEATNDCVITHSVTSAGDARYNGLVGPSVTAHVTDNDAPTVLIATGNGVAVSEATSSTADTYTVVLGNQPDADVAVNVTVPDGQSVVSTGAGAPAASLTLTFTNGNWNTAQTVSVRAVDDRIDETDPHAGAVNHGVTSTATGFATAPQLRVDGSPGGTVAVSIADNDTAGVTVAQSGGSTAVTEGGATDSYTLVLDSQPVAGVSVAVAAGAQCTAGPSPLSFDAGNWATPQTVTVTAVDDNVVEGAATCVLAHAVTSSDANYGGVAVATVTATVADNDVPLVAITAAGLTLSEATPATTTSYSVVLGAAPQANVTVTATVSDGQTSLSAGGATTAALTFTPANWNVAQNVTVWVVDDILREPNPHQGRITHTATSTAPGFATGTVFKVNGVTGNIATVSITDNDVPDLALTVSDGGTSTIPGNIVGYTLAWSNLAGGVPALGATITEIVPFGTTFVAASSTGTWTCADGSAAGTVCRTTVGTVNGGATGSVTFSVRVVSPATAGLSSLTDTASITDNGVNGVDSNTANNAGSDTTPVIAAPDLRVVTSDGGASVVPGGTPSLVSYTLTYGNFGNQNATGVRVTTTVPANSTYVSASSSPAFSCADGAVAGTACTATIGSLAGGGATGTLSFSVRVTPTVAAGVATLSDTATITDDLANGADPVPADNSSTDTTPVNAAPDLAIVLDDGGANAVAGATLTYTLRYSNVGNQGSSTVYVRATVPFNTHYNATLSTAGFSCPNNAPPPSVCLINVGALPAGGSGTVRFVVNVDTPLATTVVQIDGTASVFDDGANGVDPQSANNTSNDSAPVKR